MQGKLTVVALVVAAAGFIAQMIAGVTDTPTIPPGLVAIVAAATLVAFTSLPWAPLAAVVAGVFNLLPLRSSGLSIGSQTQRLSLASLAHGSWSSA
jgi:predicted branched-subunit amino acid permease